MMISWIWNLDRQTGVYLLSSVLNVRMVEEILDGVKVPDKDLVQAQHVNVQDSLPVHARWQGIT